MTKPEITGKRNLTFSKWIRNNLPDSEKFRYRVSDLDFILCDFDKKRIMLLEVKSGNVQMKKWQKNLFYLLSKWVREGIKITGGGWEYMGFHLIVFDKKFRDDEINPFLYSKCYLDGKEISERQLINRLSF